MTRWQHVKWWMRWIFCVFPVLVARRPFCKHEVRYDGLICLDCGHPWSESMRRR